MLACAGDAALYKDLLRKAHGNEVVAKSWMKEICGHDGGACSDTLIAASETPFPITSHVLMWSDSSRSGGSPWCKHAADDHLSTLEL